MDLQKQYRELEAECGVTLYLVAELVPSSITIEEQVMLILIRWQWLWEKLLFMIEKQDPLLKLASKF